MTQNKTRIKGVNSGGGTPTPNYTFKTTAVGGTNFAIVNTSTGYIKFNGNIYPVGIVYYTLDDPNGEYTVISCDESGNPSGNIITLELPSNQITHFNGAELSSLTNLALSDNQLTSFNGAGLTNLTTLYLNSNQLTSFNGTGLSSLTTLRLHNNLLTSFDASLFPNLLFLWTADNLLDASDNDSIINQLYVNGLLGGEFFSTGDRTSVSDTAYYSLNSQEGGWSISVLGIP